jgi:hypothetical protein
MENNISEIDLYDTIQRVDIPHTKVYIVIGWSKGNSKLFMWWRLKAKKEYSLRPKYVVHF